MLKLRKFDICTCISKRIVPQSFRSLCFRRLHAFFWVIKFISYKKDNVIIFIFDQSLKFFYVLFLLLSCFINIITLFTFFYSVLYHLYYFSSSFWSTLLFWSTVCSLETFEVRINGFITPKESIVTVVAQF